jgi:hypothetical protein
MKQHRNGSIFGFLFWDSVSPFGGDDFLSFLLASFGSGSGFSLINSQVGQNAIVRGANGSFFGSV